MPSSTARPRSRAKATALPTFEVDKAGLAKLLARRGRQFVVAELIQNAWDQQVTRVNVSFVPLGDGRYQLTVEDDDPNGFADLTHAYTLFAESNKKGDETKRGRFNLGEKLVIAVCETAEVSTTTGRVAFDGTGRNMLDAERERGSAFTGILAMSDEEADAVESLVFSLIPPEGIVTTYNGAELPERPAILTFEASLRTEKADAEGNLRPTRRKGKVRLYEPSGAKAMLYEMGIPVVDLGDDRWSVDVGQKVPVNLDRDNVPPGWLRDLRAAVLNESAKLIKGEDSAAKWIDHALEDESIKPEVVQRIVTERFGEKAVLADPTDREAEKQAVSQGYTVVPGRAFSKEAWKQVRDTGVLQRAGVVTPVARPTGDEELSTIPEGQWTKGIKRLAQHARDAAREAGVHPAINVRIANAPRWGFAATWQKSLGRNAPTLTLNVGALGYGWFDQGISDELNALLIHEFAHERASDHLSRQFYDECCRVGARLARAYAEGRLGDSPSEGGLAPRGEIG